MRGRLITGCTLTAADRRLCDSNQMLLALLRQYARPYRGPLAAVLLSADQTWPRRTCRRSTRRSSTRASHEATPQPSCGSAGDARGDRAAGVVRRRSGVFRFANRHGLRPRPAVGDLRTGYRFLRAPGQPVRHAVIVDQHNQRRPPDPVPGAAGGHRAGHRPDHVRRGHRDGRSPIRWPVLAAVGRRAGAGRRQLRPGVSYAAAFPQHAQIRR